MKQEGGGCFGSILISRMRRQGYQDSWYGRKGASDSRRDSGVLVPMSAKVLSAWRLLGCVNAKIPRPPGDEEDD